jgi:hypothetical protein
MGLLTQGAVREAVDLCAHLHQLDLSNVRLHPRVHLPLCKAVGGHPTLQKVNMSQTGLDTPAAKSCIVNLLECAMLRDLDLSWNAFDTTVFKALGAAVTGSHTLRKLSVANCSGQIANTMGVEDVDPPIAHFIEYLSQEAQLRFLDLSLNRIDFRTALVIEDSLELHRELAELVLSQNPLGLLGTRSLLRLLSRETCGLLKFSSRESHLGVEDADNQSKSSQSFTHANPGGRYVLDLARPYHRAHLRMLYKTCDRLCVSRDEALRLISSTVPYAHGPQNEHGVWQVPKEGTVTLFFDQEKYFEARLGKVEPSDFHGVIAAHYETLRLRPGYSKIVPMMVRWKELDGNAPEQRIFIKALAKDFNLDVSDLAHLVVSSRNMAKETLLHLLPCIPDERAHRWLAMQSLSCLGDFLWTTMMTEKLRFFNISNPTGHYRLDLANCCEFGVAERLLLLDRWEGAVDRQLNRTDTSSRANHSHFRNECYQGNPLYLRVASVADWNLPEDGIFEFDYISNLRPSASAEVLSDFLWEATLMKLHFSVCNQQSKILVLRTISHNFWINSMHMRQLIGFFRLAELRAEVFVTYFLRITDMYNAKFFRVRFEDREEIQKLQERLGFAVFFPFIQPEHMVFDLDLYFSDQRICASMLVKLSMMESPTNIRAAKYILADGKVDPLLLGVPRSWQEPAKVPKQGKFSGVYICAPEHRAIKLRNDLAQTYGYQQVSITEEDVNWWTGLTEAPEDVLEFLEFLMSWEGKKGERFENVEETFEFIDGVDGNKQITLREFEEAFANLECNKFKGPGDKDSKVQKPGEKKRIGEIFRYLDPGGEGTVSKGEWMILDQLWKELELSIKEFVQFLCLMFGEDLSQSWEVLDEDGSGEMDLGEFLNAVEKCGYFGPAKIVFSLLDSSDDGNISIDEFLTLEKYVRKDGDETEDKY